jgi:hypothetical protein
VTVNTTTSPGTQPAKKALQAGEGAPETNWRDHVRRFPDLAAAVAKLSARSVVLDVEVGPATPCVPAPQRLAAQRKEFQNVALRRCAPTTVPTVSPRENHCALAACAWATLSALVSRSSLPPRGDSQKRGAVADSRPGVRSRNSSSG